MKTVAEKRGDLYAFIEASGKRGVTSEACIAHGRLMRNSIVVRQITYVLLVQMEKAGWITRSKRTKRWVALPDHVTFSLPEVTQDLKTEA